MSARKRRLVIRTVFVLPVLIGLVVFLGQPASLEGQRTESFPFGLGDIPLDAATYQSTMKSVATLDALPSSYDARNDGIVTVAKNQGSCGSCWSFAATGAMESHMLKQYGVGPSDLSEQQQTSCNLGMAGCCGGSMSSLQYWETTGPIYESCFPYGESSTSCPTQRTVACAGSSGCEQLVYRVTDYYTVTPTTEQFKTSLYNDGPSYWRYDVYSDFYTYWNSGSPGDVYTNVSGTSRQGGHAILLIGWDDGKGAFLARNSWGASGGPNNDGTFWISYTGHYNNLGFGMANFTLTGGSTGSSLCLDIEPYCNDEFLSYESLDGVFSVHGYEYGCGSNDSQTFGSIKLAGGYAYFGLTKINPGADNGMRGLTSVPIDMASKTGSGVWNWIYMSGGSLTAHGGSSNYTLRFCGPQALSSKVSGADNSKN